MSIYDLKPKFQNLLRPLVIKLEQRGVTANQVTLTACAISVILGLILTALSGYHWLFILIPIWLFVRMALNAIDGMLAREFNQKSRLGGYLNEITDVVSDAALYLPFAFVYPFDGLQIGLIIWLSALTEFCGVLLVYVFAPTLLDFLYWVLWVDIILLIVTCVKRVKSGLAEVGNE